MPWQRVKKATSIAAGADGGGVLHRRSEDVSVAGGGIGIGRLGAFGQEGCKVGSGVGDFVLFDDVGSLRRTGGTVLKLSFGIGIGQSRLYVPVAPFRGVRGVVRPRRFPPVVSIPIFPCTFRVLRGGLGLETACRHATARRRARWAVSLAPPWACSVPSRA